MVTETSSWPIEVHVALEAVSSTQSTFAVSQEAPEKSAVHTQAQSSLALAQADSGAAGMGHQHKYAGAIDGLRTVRARRAAGQPVEAAPPQRAAW